MKINFGVEFREQLCLWPPKLIVHMAVSFVKPIFTRQVHEPGDVFSKMCKTNPRKGLLAAPDYVGILDTPNSFPPVQVPAFLPCQGWIPRQRPRWPKKNTWVFSLFEPPKLGTQGPIDRLLIASYSLGSCNGFAENTKKKVGIKCQSHRIHGTSIFTCMTGWFLLFLCRQIYTTWILWES